MNESINAWQGPHLTDIREAFSLFDDWEDRYRYLIDLAKYLPPMGDDVKTESNIVRGCTSRVWMVTDFRNGMVRFVADSDAHIVKGLIGLLMAIYNEQPTDTLRTLPVEQVFEELGLAQNISPNRRNGFFAMVERLKAEA
jgi:cysteine desulfuration protein SufE